MCLLVCVHLGKSRQVEESGGLKITPVKATPSPHVCASVCDFVCMCFCVNVCAWLCVSVCGSV